MSFTGDLHEIVEKNENGLLGAHASWLRVPLGEVATILNGFPFDSRYFSKSEGVPLIRIRDILSESTDTKYTGPLPDGYWVTRGDILVGMDGDFNCARWRGAPALLNQRVCKLVGRPDYIVDSFLHRVLGGYLAAINRCTPSITVKHLSSKTIADIPLPYPSFPEQKRIADKLDALLERADACRGRLDRIGGILKRFRQSVIAAATGGELTREWREERKLDIDGWSHSTVGQLIEGIEAGVNVQCEERPPAENERGLVKISAVTWGTYDDKESKTLPRSAKVPERSRIRRGDFLISRANTLELVGACVIVHLVTRPVFLSDKILRLVMPEELKPWVLLVLQSPAGRREIEARASGNQLSMRNLSQANLRELQIPIPSPHERAEIVRRVESLLGVAREIERRCRGGQAIVDKLTPSVLAKAFRGELVPQGPSNEPASELLIKLRAEHSNTGVPARRRPKTLGRRADMGNTDKDTIKAAILKLKTDRFSFDELSAQFAGDYESLKAALFELLQEPSPVIRQVFDKKAKAMQLVRVRS